MAKADLIRQAQDAGLVASDVNERDYTVAQLEELLTGEEPAWQGSLSSTSPIVAPDGHVVLSQEDIEKAG